MLALWGVLAPMGWAQTVPARFDVSPGRIEQGECYTISVGTPNITLDVKYRFNNGSSIILYGWPSIGSGGTARICTSSQTAPGVYTFVEARNTLGGAWVSSGDRLTVTAPPPPDFTLTASPSSRSVGPTDSATYTVSVSPRNGFNSTVNLRVSGLSANVTATFSRSALSFPYTSTSTLTLTTNGASAGTRSVTLTGAGGSLSRTDSVELRVVVPQPTTYRMSPTEGYAGAHTVRATVGNGANMSLDLRYTINGGPTREGTVQLDANGRWSYRSTRDDVIGIYRYTGMKNALAPEWVSINETYTVRPPQPTTMRISPSSLTLPGRYTMRVGNGAGMTLDVGYTLEPPGGTEVTKPNIHGWPVLTAVSAGSSDGRAVIDVSGCTLPGVYRFTKMRNALHDREADWVNVSATVRNRAPVSVTSVSPSGIAAGASATVTLRGEHLCDLTLSTSYPGVRISNVVFDPVAGDGTRASARITVASTAPGGTATIEVDAGEGSTSFDLTIVPPPDFTLTASPGSRSVGPTDSADYTVSVSPRNGFNSTVNLRVSGLGSNVTAAFSPSALSSPNTATSTLTLRTNGAAAGTRTVTITGTGGGLSRTDSVDLRIGVAQPTTYRMSVDEDESYAGAHTVRATVGNGANMSLDLRYRINGGATREGTIQLDANGRWSYRSTRDDVVGIYRYTEMKNALAATWVSIDETYTVRPPQPTTMRISPSSLTLPDEYTMRVGNGAGIALDVGYTLQPPGGTRVTKPDIHGWPVLTAVSPGSADGIAVIDASGCTLPGEYRFTKMRNTLHDRDVDWVTLDPVVTVTNRAPVSVTSVSPSSISVGASARVRLRGEGLCDLTLSTSYPGVRISNVVFDPVEGAGTIASAMIEVDATAAAGTATIEVDAGEGTASFDLSIVPAPDFTIEASPGSQYAAPTGRAAYTVSVTPVSGFDQDVTLSVGENDLPANVMAVFNPSALSPPNSATSTLTLMTDGATVGTRTVTLTGTGGGIERTDLVELVVVPQPTTFRFSESLSCAGSGDTTTLTVGNGANMRLDLRYTLNGVPKTRTIQLDANGQWAYSPPRDAVTGTFVYTGMKNALLSDWVPIDSVTYTVCAPQPTSMNISPSILDLPGSYTMTVGNGADMALDVGYTLEPPPGGTQVTKPDIHGWPELTAVSPGSADGIAEIYASGCTLPGVYRFNKMRNTLNAAWVPLNPPVTVTNRAPVSVTSVAPTGIVVGTSAEVALEGEHLCALELSTTYPGVTISEVTFDPVEGAGTRATAMIAVDATAAAGTATVEVDAGEGTASFNLTIGPPPGFTITASPRSPYVAPYLAPTGSAAYTVTVVPVSGFAEDVTLSVGGLGANVMAGFNPSVLRAPYTSTSTLTLTTDGASMGTRTVTLTGTGEGLLSTASVELRVVAQPTSFQISADAGYAGTDTMTATVGGAAGMRVDLRFTVNGGREATYRPMLNASRQWLYRLPRSEVFGPYGEWVFTGMKNALLSDWVPINVTYTVRPPQPTTMRISPDALTVPGSYTMRVGNGAGLTLDVQYTLTPPGGTPGPVQTLYGWPVLTVAGRVDGTVDISAGADTPPGVYRFTAMRNTLNTAWVRLDPPVDVTIRSLLPQDFTITATPESRTVESGGSATVATYTVTVVPANGFAEDVTLNATGLGSNVTAVFDPEVLSAPYTDSTLTLTVAALATAGTRTVTITGTGGGLSRTDAVDLRVAVPQPTTMRISPSILDLPGSYTMTVGNGADMTLDVGYTLEPPPGGTEVAKPDIHGWPVLSAAGPGSSDGTAEIYASGCTLPGVYRFNKMRNTLNAAWVPLNPPVTVTNRAPVSVTAVEPTRIVVGTSAEVALEGEHLCALELSTTYPGVTISEVTFDPVEGAGTRATAMIAVDATAAAGTATVEVDAGEGTASFNLTIGPPPGFTITASPRSPYVAPYLAPTGSAAYTVTVVPVSGFAEDVTLSVGGLGANVMADFNPSVLRAPYTSTSTLTLTTDGASMGTRTVTLTGTGEGLLSTASVELRVVAQPTSFQISADAGYAGTDTMTATVGGAAGMRVDLRFTVNGGREATYRPMLNASRQWLYRLPRSEVFGPYGEWVFTGMKNALLSDWVPINVTYTVRPPQPMTMSISPSTLTLPGSYTFRVGNGADMALDVRYTLEPPGGVAVEKPDLYGWPVLTAVSPGSADGIAEIFASGCTLPGMYRFTKMRNTLNAAWVELDPPVEVTNLAPVSVTSVVPPGALPPAPGGTAAAVPVTITGTGLCALELSTTYAGLTISDVVFDGVAGAGISATATFHIAPGTLPGIAEIDVRAGGGTTTFDFIIGTAPPATGFTITATPALGYAPATGSATYEVTVTPALDFTAAVTLSVDADSLGWNVMASFNPVTLSAPYTSTSTLILMTNRATVGTRTVTLTGTGGGLGSTAAVDLQVVPQPTTFEMTPEEGYAGAHTVLTTVGNGANMSLDLRYTINGKPHEPGTIQLDASGQRSYISTRNDVVGEYHFTEMKNTLASEWVSIDETYTVLAPQPLTMRISPSVLELPGIYTLRVGNGADMALDVRYTLKPPGGVAVEKPDIPGWPVLTAVNPGSADGIAEIFASGCTLPGLYNFTEIRNTRHNREQDWVDVSATVTTRAPVSVTSVVPPGALPPAPGGTAVVVPVTITGTGFCAPLELSTTYVGLTISDVVFDGVTGAGTSMTATFTIAPGTLPGIAEIVVTAGGGTTTFDFIIGPTGTRLSLNVAATVVSEDPDVPPVSGAPPNAGQSVAMTVTVTPPPVSGTSYTGCNIRAVAPDTTAGATDYFLPASGLDIRAVDSWSQTFTFWVLDDTEDDDDETLVLEAFCTGGDPAVAPGALVSEQLAFLITDNDLAATFFTITAAPESGTVAPGGMAAYTVSLTPLDGFNQAVTLSASGLPTGVMAAFDPAVLSAPYTGTSTLTLTAAAEAAEVTAAVTVTGTAGPVLRTFVVNLTVTTTGPGLQREYIYLGGRVIAVESP